MKMRSSLLYLMITCFGVAEAHHTAAYQSEILAKELARRQAAASDAEQFELEADELLATEDIAGALAKYEAAYDLIPDAPITAESRTSLKSKIDSLKADYALELKDMGNVAEAKSLVQTVAGDLETSKSNKKKATKVLEILEDTRKTNPSLTPEFIQDKDKVDELLKRANGFYELGLYDDALSTYEQALFIDPYSSSARDGMAKVSKAKSNYYGNSARKETRAFMLQEVERTWERALSQNNAVELDDTSTPSATSLALSLKRKAQEIIIPDIDFEGETLGEALDIIRLRSREFDPAQQGVNIVVEDTKRTDADGEVLPSINEEIIYSLRLSNVSVFDLIKVLANQFELYPQYNEFAIQLVDGKTQLFNRTFRVDTGFKDNLDNGSGGGAVSTDPFADVGGGGSLSPKKTVKELLAQRGVNFGQGESASLFGSRLVVRGTSQTLELVEIIVDNMRKGAPKQVMVKSKFIEVEQTDRDELGFDWYFDTLNFASGTQVTSGDVGFTNTDALITSGLRSGSEAIGVAGLDGIVNNTDRTAVGLTPADGIASFTQTNILGGSALSVLIRGVKQRKGVDLLSAPSVVTKPGLEAKIEIIREMRFPTEYEPPQIPQNVGNGITITTGDDDLAATPSTVPVTPANPNSFETKDVGISLSVSPDVADDARTINLELSPEIIEFDGFINYGSPITSAGFTLTENRIEMPVFSQRSVSSSLTIYDGNTVALGGLITEEVSKVDDSVPLLGDIPIIGRLFQSKSEQTIKTNLMILVTAEIIDASGSPLRLANSATPSDN